MNYLKKFIKKNVQLITGAVPISFDSLVKKDDRSQQTERRIIALESFPTPEATSLPLREECLFHKRKYWTPPEAYVSYLQGIFFDPVNEVLIKPSLLMPSFKIISDSVVQNWNTPSKEFIKKRFLTALFSKKIVRVQGYTCLFQSSYYGYYQSLIVNTPRVYLLKETQYCKSKNIQLLLTRKLNKVEKFLLPKIITNSNQVKLKYLEAERDKLYFLENIIFPSFMTTRFCGYIPQKIVNEVLKKSSITRARNKQNRIYISRSLNQSKRTKRHILNEKKLFNELSKFGFKKIHLEQLSMKETINLFYDAEIVIGAHGAGLSHIVFSDKIPVLELHPMQKIYPHYYFLSKTCGHKYYYLCSDNSKLHSNFSVDVSQVLKITRESLGNNK